MVDILEFMLPDQVWALTHHLEVDGGGEPKYTLVTGNQIWYIKGKNGYPWDMNTFDSENIYQSITEVSWDDPHTFKIFASKSWPGANGGVAWAPRQYNSSHAPLTQPSTPGLVTDDSSFRLYSDCANYTTHNLGGRITTRVEGPYCFNFGGDLQSQWALQLSYYWGDFLEVNKYVEEYGWVQWENWQLQNGRYVQQKVSAFNRIVDGGGVAPVFPCGVPVIK